VVKNYVKRHATHELESKGAPGEKENNAHIYYCWSNDGTSIKYIVNVILCQLSKLKTAGKRSHRTTTNGCRTQVAKQS
jgi:hypothetical protein